MSLIFKALKKLKSSPLEKDAGLAARRDGNIYSLRKIMLSPSGLVLTLFFLFILGALSIYTLDALKSRSLPKKRGPAVTAAVKTKKNNESRSNDQAPADDIEEEPEPLPPDQMTEEGITPGKLILPVKKNLSSNTLVPEETEYEEKGDPESAKISGAETEMKISGVYETSGHGNLTLPADFGTDSKAKPKQDKIYLKRIKQARQITSLVAKIRKTAEQGHGEISKKLMDSLIRLKGKDDSYVLKLKSYILLKRGDFPSAALLLERVLAKNKDDRDAGLNMAVAEAGMGKIAVAVKRLLRLQEIYPDDIGINEFLEKMKNR